MNLRTTYMGLELSSPIVVSASTLSEETHRIMEMEEAGAGAVVLFSLFEEQIRAEQARYASISHATSNSFAEASSFFPSLDNYAAGTEDYLEKIWQAKNSVDIPIIASLNGTTPEGWIEYAKQIEGYRRSLLDISTPAGSANSSRQLVSRLDAMTRDANKLLENGRLPEANKRMADTYKLAVEEITKMREGQEVVMKLSFASPREEFLYEQKRFHSSEIMLGMMLKEKQSSPENIALIQKHAGSADELRGEANSKAGNNDYSGAVKDMEKAIQQLNRALQILGLPVF